MLSCLPVFTPISEPRDLREDVPPIEVKLDLLYAFQNEKKVFTAADHRYKQVVAVVTKH